MKLPRNHETGSSTQWNKDKVLVGINEIWYPACPQQSSNILISF